MIIIGGTGGVTMASCGMDAMKKVPTLYKIVFGPPEIDLNARVQQLVGFAEQARREGLLALDGQTRRDRGRLHPQGPAARRRRLRPRARPRGPRGRDRRHDGPPPRAGAAPFEKAGGFAPTMGIIGTVMGLVHVLAATSRRRPRSAPRSPRRSSRR